MYGENRAVILCIKRETLRRVVDSVVPFDASNTHRHPFIQQFSVQKSKTSYNVVHLSTKTFLPSSRIPRAIDSSRTIGHSAEFRLFSSRIQAPSPPDHVYKLFNTYSTTVQRFQSLPFSRFKMNTSQTLSVHSDTRCFFRGFLNESLASRSDPEIVESRRHARRTRPDCR